MQYALMTGESCMRNKKLRACRASDCEKDSRNKSFLNFRARFKGK